jgi:N-acyl homoserine lactone hydrolase
MTDADGSGGVELVVIVTATIRTPYGYVFRQPGNRLARLRAALSAGDEALISPCLAYVIRHPSAGVILVDTGMHPDAGVDLRKDFGVGMGLLFRGLRPAAKPFDDQLRELGVEPDDVRSVAMTHLHVHHTSGMRLLPNANFICSNVEWRSAHSRFASGRGYVAHHLPPEERITLLDFDRDGEAFGPFRTSLDFLGDGTVRLLFTPGHTKGHMSMLLRLTDGSQVLLVGDAAYTVRSLREQLLPMLTDDDEASRRSLRELREFSDDDPDAILVPTHDPVAWQSLKAVAAVHGESLLD